MEIERLKDYGISESLITRLKELGFQRLTKVQEMAVKKGLFNGKNLVISAPTNTGKTFIAELAALSAAKQTKGTRTFYLVPLKAIAEEKFEEFGMKYGGWGLNIAISTGERSEFDDNLTEYDLIIATYEKLNALLVKNPNLIKDIGVVVVDELQMVGDEERGVDLEVLLTKLRHGDDPPQIIGLSATIPNAKELVEWLNAELIETNEREIELREGIVYLGDKPIKFGTFEINKGDFLYKEFNSRNIDLEKTLLPISHIGEFIRELTKLAKEEQILIFVDTQKRAENLALKLRGNLQPPKNITRWIKELETFVEPTPSTRKLKKCLLKGVAFHHAGMLLEEKRIVEDAFDCGDVRIVCATSTLGAGINSPAKNVIILSTKYWDGKNIRIRDYKNMAGRAGRIKYHDDFGRSLLFARTEKDFERLWQSYINQEPEEVESQIPKKGLESSILNLVASSVCKKKEDIIKFIENTFFGYIFYQEPSGTLKESIEDTILKQIQDLIEMRLLIEEDGRIRTTELGRRAAEEMISPRSAYIIYQSLKQHENKIKSTSDYEQLVEPILQLMCCTPDARLLYTPRNRQEIRELITYYKANKDVYLYHPPEQEHLLRVIKTVQMLLRWVDGVPYSDLEGFAPHGVIKNIGENISWLIKSMIKIIEYPLFEFPEEFTKFLLTLSERVKYGVRENAVELMKINIPGIHRNRAMLLAEAGYSSLDSFLEATIEDMKKVKGINEKLAIKIVEYIDNFVEDNAKRLHRYLIRRAVELKRDPEVLRRLFEETEDNFSKTCADVFNNYLGIKCSFIGDLSPHEPDCIIELRDGKKIVIECKRKKGGRLVSATEAEEIIGKGLKYDPLANVTIGFPNFTDEAKENVENTKITLLKYSALAEILIAFWEGNLSKEEIIEILKSGRYIGCLENKNDKSQVIF